MKAIRMIKLSTKHLKSKFDKNSIVNNQYKILEDKMQKLKYEKFNNSNDIIIIDLHNGYTVIAITGFNIENRVDAIIETKYTDPRTLDEVTNYD